jgi:hypothetical protein
MSDGWCCTDYLSEHASKLAIGMFIRKCHRRATGGVWCPDGGAYEVAP